MMPRYTETNDIDAQTGTEVINTIRVREKDVIRAVRSKALSTHPNPEYCVLRVTPPFKAEMNAELYLDTNTELYFDTNTERYPDEYNPLHIEPVGTGPDALIPADGVYFNAPTRSSVEREIRDDGIDNPEEQRVDSLYSQQLTSWAEKLLGQKRDSIALRNGHVIDIEYVDEWREPQL